MNDLSLSDILDAIEVEVIYAKEVWSEYRLADGKMLRVKPVMIAVSRVGNAESALGEPVYNMRSTLITDVRDAKRPPQRG